MCFQIDRERAVQLSFPLYLLSFSVLAKPCGKRDRSIAAQYESVFALQAPLPPDTFISHWHSKVPPPLAAGLILIILASLFSSCQSPLLPSFLKISHLHLIVFTFSLISSTLLSIPSCSFSSNLPLPLSFCFLGTTLSLISSSFLETRSYVLSTALASLISSFFPFIHVPFFMRITDFFPPFAKSYTLFFFLLAYV